MRDYMRGAASGRLFSRWSGRIVNELGRFSREAQDFPLNCLDRLRLGWALLATRILLLDLLTERFQTRFQAVKV